MSIYFECIGAALSASSAVGRQLAFMLVAFSVQSNFLLVLLRLFQFSSYQLHTTAEGS